MTKKTKERASADVGLIFIAYNLKRLINILGIKTLQDFLRKLVLYLNAKISTLKKQKLKNTLAYIFSIIRATEKDNCLKSFILSQNLVNCVSY